MSDPKDDPPAAASAAALPASIVDAHHHYIDTSLPHSSWLAGVAGPDLKYTPEAYLADVRDDLASAGITLAGSVHVEAMPDDGADEVAWVEGFERDGRSVTVAAIVGSVDLARGGGAAAASDAIAALKASSPTGKVRGVRWMVDCVGKFDGGKSKTHVATSRHDGVDYLRGSDGGYDGSAVPEFEEGYAQLAEHGLTFDLQCAPDQLVAAAELAARHPGVKVVIDHLGKPRRVLGDETGDENENVTPEEGELQLWRTGMRAMADVPHAYVKLSMLGYAVPGWAHIPAREEVVKSIVLEVVEMFGPTRCMFATNWWANASMSDSDGACEKGPGAAELVTKVAGWLAEGGYGEEDRARIFRGTAEDFYGIGSE